MVFGPSGHVHDPQNQLYLNLGPPHFVKQTHQEKVAICPNVFFCKSQIIGNRKLHVGGKRRVPENLELFLVVIQLQSSR